MKFIIFIIQLFILFNYCLQCESFCQQETQKPTKLILTDGSELNGVIISEDSISVHFKTTSNISITIPREQIKSMEPLSGESIGGEYIRQDPNHTRLFFAPTARPLRARQGYFSAYQIFFPFFAVGVTDFLTLGGGISLLPGATSQFVYFAPKIIPIETENFSIAGGLLYINSTMTAKKGVGIYYFVGSYGKEKTSITAGLGWGFLGNNVADKPICLIGGEFRLTNTLKLITENWLIYESDNHLLSLGFRFFGKNLAADFALVYPFGVEMKGFPFIPWIGFAYNFGVKK